MSMGEVDDAMKKAQRLFRKAMVPTDGLVGEDDVAIMTGLDCLGWEVSASLVALCISYAEKHSNDDQDRKSNLLLMGLTIGRYLALNNNPLPTDQ